jgi:hypothetical protein
LPQFAKHVVTHCTSQMYITTNTYTSPWKFVRGCLLY